MNLPLIAIDGPAGVGKSTTARAVALRLGIPFLDTGALYRAVTYAVMKNGISATDVAAVKRLLEKVKLTIIPGDKEQQVWLDDENVTQFLRSPEVTQKVSEVCEIHEVRIFLVDMQRNWARRGFGVVEGRDIGTVVFPKAGLKIFMTANPDIRAFRRGKDLGISEDSQALSTLSKELARRDKRDSERADSPLRQAADAMLIDTSDMTLDEQINAILRIIGERFSMKLFQAVPYVD